MALEGFGTTLEMSDMADAEPTFNKIAGVLNIPGPNFTRDTEDVTDNDSEDQWEEVLPTIKRSGEVPLDVHFNPSNQSHTDAMTAFDDGDIRDFKLVFPDDATTTWEFSGFVTGVETEEPFDGKITGTITIKISGKPTITGVNDA